MDEKLITDFWENNPCGQQLIVGADSRIDDFKDFFVRYDEFRYASESHILSNLGRIDFKNKRVLEIGIGQASDSQQIIDRGAKYYGMDITKEACMRASLRFRIFNRPYKLVVHSDATAIPFRDGFFDIIYAHGVLHHIPAIERVVPELRRVLKSGGRLIIMVYAKKSLNYYLSIMFLRRVMFMGLFFLDKITFGRVIKKSLLRRHIENAEAVGLFRYLEAGNFLSRNTDGPENPYSRVYTENDVINIFKGFTFSSFEQHFLHERHLPFLKLLSGPLKAWLANKAGWHLWCYGVKNEPRDG